MMRESLARAAALGTTVAVTAAVGTFAALQQRAPDVPPRPPAERPADPDVAGADTPLALVDRGRSVYGDSGCATCHSIAGQGSPRFPLDGVGSRLSTQEIRLWIVVPQQIRPGVRKPAYDHLSEEELAALIAYMESV